MRPLARESAKSAASSSASVVAEKGLASAARSLADGRLPRVDVSRFNCGAHLRVLGVHSFLCEGET